MASSAERAGAGLRVTLAVGGSIAAYKAAELVSWLVKRGHQTQVLLGAGGSRFITQLTLETLSGRPVASELFGPGVSGTEHIRLARWPDVLVFAPATAHQIARLSLGLADDLVTTVALATRAPWCVAPAMNTAMWEAPPTREHVARLRERGVAFVEPASGTLACGEEGEGKLADVAAIGERIEFLARGAGLARPADLSGRRVLITAGPTTSRIDAVRYLTNPSTGRMGAALAEEALARGAEVFYVLGIDKGVVRPRVPAGAEARFHLAEVRTAEEMGARALAWLPGVDGVIAAAAVLDYRVAAPEDGKRKRLASAERLELVPSLDVLAALRSAARPGQWFMGFAAETDDLDRNASSKLAGKRLDYLFANVVGRSGERIATGFGSETNAGTLLRAGGRASLPFAHATKTELAGRIWDFLRDDLAARPAALS